jgi:hypothetical protein
LAVLLCDMRRLVYFFLFNNDITGFIYAYNTITHSYSGVEHYDINRNSNVINAIEMSLSNPEPPIQVTKLPHLQGSIVPGI